MTENTAPARCSEAEYSMARDAGLLVVTTADEAAIHKFAEAIRASQAEHSALAGRQGGEVRDYGQSQFEVYAESQGLRDFEFNEFGDYRNSSMQWPWNFWRASRDALRFAAPTSEALQSAAPADEYVGARMRLVCKLAGVPIPNGDDKHLAECAFTLLGSVRAAMERANQALANSIGLSIASLADPKGGVPGWLAGPTIGRADGKFGLEVMAEELWNQQCATPRAAEAPAQDSGASAAGEGVKHG
jgi:hypothetical protein